MVFPPALYGFYWGALSKYPFWYIHTRIGHVSSVFTSDSSLWFLCRCILNVSLLEHLYSHSSHWNSWGFWFSNGLLWFLKIYLCEFSFFLDLYSHWVHSCWSSVSISTFAWSYNKVPQGNKGRQILTGITGTTIFIGSKNIHMYQIIHRYHRNHSTLCLELTRQT